jgi:hypothetical protein
LSFTTCGFVHSQSIYKEKGKYGILGQNQELIFTAEFDTIYRPFLNEEQISFFRFYILGKQDSYDFLAFYTDPKARDKRDTIYTSFEFFDSNCDTIFWETKMPQELDRKQQVLSERSCLRTKKNGKHGLIIIYWTRGISKNLNGYYDITGIEKTEVLPSIYDSIVVNVYPQLWSKQKVGIFFSEDEIVFPQYDSIRRVSGLEDKFYVWNGGKCGMVDRKGRILHTAYDIKDIYYYNGNENNEIHIVTEGEPYTRYDLKTKKFTTFVKDDKPILNNDSIDMVFGDYNTTILKFECIKFINKNYVQPYYINVYDRIVYAYAESGVVFKDYSSDGFKYFTYGSSFRFLFKVKMGDRQKLQITMIEPLSERVICAFSAYVFEKKSFLGLESYKGFYRLEVLNKKGNAVVVGFIDTIDDSFSKKEPK